jgi:hypothetical protein
MRVLVTGDREWSSPDTIYDVLVRLKAIAGDLVVIHGGCRGADTIAGMAAVAIGCAVEVYPADWDRYHRRAGPIRNQQMIDEGRPEFAVAFHPDLKKSKGTADMVRRLRQSNVAYDHYRE